MINLGEKCRDKVTGFEGICIARTEWLNGCARVTLQPKVGKDMKLLDNATFDEPQIEVIGKGLKPGPRDTGGPMDLIINQKSGPKR